MLTKFKVENFKSIHSLELELGRVNVFIGENGSGKSNVLEAVALASAALQDRLDHEFLAPRGIRVTAPELMRSGFEKESETNHVFLRPWIDHLGPIPLILAHTNQRYARWGAAIKTTDPDYVANHVGSISKPLLSLEELGSEKRREWAELMGNFIIYSPENTTLRTLQAESQILPLGKNGEGLFALLQYFASEENQQAIKELNRHLQLFNWFESFTLPEHLWPGESYLKIKDRFLDANIDYIDQRSANEGFLFVLFYLALLISQDTPKFFAIDNIESALNPILCTKLMAMIAEICIQYNKQIIVTTHNPAILDGINLNDDSQRLFSIYRNSYGHTVAKRILKPRPVEGQPPVKLSTLFLQGHLGGVPKHFSL
jgi:predicted ATPase